MKLLKTLALAAAVSMTMPAALASPETSAMAEPAPGEILMAEVNGLVCDFCAQSIRKIVGRDETRSRPDCPGRISAMSASPTSMMTR